MEEELIEKKNKKIRAKKSEKSVNIIFDILAIICIIIMAIAVSPKALQNDTFYNIKCGEYIFRNGLFHLTEDPFSWHSLPYTWPHWLFDLFTFFVYHFSRKSLGIRFLYYNDNTYCYSRNGIIPNQYEGF